MALSYDVALRNLSLDNVTDQIDAGSGEGHVHFYDGAKPSGGGTPTTLLAHLDMSAISFAVASSGSITANAITSENALATGTCTWFRIVDSDDNYVLDGTVGLADSGADLILDNTDFVLGALVELDSLIITHGNA